MNLKQLRSLLNSARTTAQREKIRQLIRRLEMRKHNEPNRQTRRLLEQILAAVTEDRPTDEIERLIDSYEGAISQWAYAEAIAARRQARIDAVRYLFTAASVVQLRAIFRLPFDRLGKVKAPPQTVPPLEIDNPTEQQLLEHISPLLHITGSVLEERDYHPIDQVVKVLESASPSTRVSADPTIRAAVIRQTQSLRQVVRLAIANVTENLTDWFRERLLKPLGLSNRRPEDATYPEQVGGLVGELRLRERGRAASEIEGMLAGDAYVGYTLHSAFAVNTRPHHARRDGAKFYLDDREGSYLPWEQRIQPPYWFDNEATEQGQRSGGRCLCFTIPRLETPEGFEYSAEFGVRNSGGIEITARDVGTLRNWFNGQRSGVRRQLVGADRWEAVNDDLAELERFYGLNGKLVPAARLRAETPEQTRSRVDRVRAIMDAQEQRHREAWERWNYNDRFDGQIERERRYLERLRRLFAAVTA